MPVDESQPNVIGAAYSSITPDLKRLCSTHNLDVTWVDQCEDCDQLLSRVLSEFEGLLDQTPLEAGGSERLSGLIYFAAGAASLHEKAASSAAMRKRLEELERENRELRSAVSEGDGSALEIGDARREERLDETFRALASLAHKINNPLTALIGRTQLMRMMGATDERTLKAMSVIEESARRVADYVRELALLVKDSRDRELGPK